MKERVNKYAIRKLSVGAASVLIGTAFMVNANPAQAAEDSADIQTSTEKVETVDSKAVTPVEKTVDEQTTDQADKAVDKTVDEKLEKSVDEKVEKTVDKQVEKLSDKKTEKQEADEQPSETKKDIDDNAADKKAADNKAGDATEKVPAASKPETTKEPVSDVDEKTYKEYPLAPVQTVQGTVPDAEMAIPDWRNYAAGLCSKRGDYQNPEIKVDWVQTPDTSKIGVTEGTIKISYKCKDGTYKAFPKDFKVPVHVYAQEKDYLQDEGNFTGDEVANTVQFYDVVNKRFLRTDRFHGAKNSYPEEAAYYDTAVPEFLDYIGYQEASKIGDIDYRHDVSPYTLLYFDDHDQYMTVFIEPQSYGDKSDWTKVPVLRYSTQDTFVPALKENASHDGRYGDCLNPARYIENLLFLPDDTTVEWGEQPELAKDAASDRLTLQNHPKIKVAFSDKGTGEHKTFSLDVSELVDKQLFHPFVSDAPQYDANFKAQQGDDADANAVIIKTADNLPKPKMSWLLAPFTSKSGLTWGVLQPYLATGNVAAYILTQVVPKAPKPVKDVDNVVNYIDDGTGSIIKTDSVKGKAGDPIAISIPSGYHLNGELPSFVIDPVNTVHVVHLIKDQEVPVTPVTPPVVPEQPETPSDKPDNPDTPTTPDLPDTPETPDTPDDVEVPDLPHAPAAGDDKPTAQKPTPLAHKTSAAKLPQTGKSVLSSVAAVTILLSGLAILALTKKKRRN